MKKVRVIGDGIINSGLLIGEEVNLLETQEEALRAGANPSTTEAIFKNPHEAPLLGIVKGKSNTTNAVYADTDEFEEVV